MKFCPKAFLCCPNNFPTAFQIKLLSFHLSPPGRSFPLQHILICLNDSNAIKCYFSLKMAINITSYLREHNSNLTIKTKYDHHPLIAWEGSPATTLCQSRNSLHTSTHWSLLRWGRFPCHISNSIIACSFI